VHSVGNLAPKVTKVITDALASRKQNTKPLPRVLFIGDSITGSYIKSVMKNLDDKAFVCKNPGNGESTWNGLRKIDQWLDLKRYLLNGQEYMELVDGVKYALTQLDRVVPGYKNQGFELGGMVWLQGIADAKSDAHTAAYEKNLVHLIGDLRKAFEAPKLPFIVAGMGAGTANMTGNTRKVFDAQMAVGDPGKYPQFAGNVTSVDLREFCRTPEQSPGGRTAYHGNAETCLEIGKAMADAMLKMEIVPFGEKLLAVPLSALWQ
jgi:hypothetical protein